MKDINEIKIKEIFARNRIEFQEDGDSVMIPCPFCQYINALGDAMATFYVYEATDSGECFNCGKKCIFSELFEKLGIKKEVTAEAKKKEVSAPRSKQSITKSDSPKKYIASEILADDRIIEMVYRPEYRLTQFAVFDGIKVEYLDKVELPHEILLPHPATNPLIFKKVILFPSEALEYGEEKELIDKIQAFLHKYLDITPFFEKIATYYVLFTWAFEQFNELAYLRALGDYGSGKSRLLQVMGSVCYKAMFVGGATTTSPIFRIIDAFRGTLILDEADYRFSDTTVEIIKILNSGYQKGIPVLRSEGKGTFEVKAYDVFCPKIVATRQRFNDQALESRFLIEEMDKKELRNDIPINLPESFENEALELRNQLLMWRFKNLSNAKLSSEDLDRTLEPRLNQIIMPLLSIIKDPEMKVELKQFVKEYNSQLVSDRGMSLESEVFESILKCFDTGYPEPTMKQIADTYGAELSDKEKLTPRKIGGIIRKQLKLMPRRTKEGYVIAEAENADRIKALKKKYGVPDKSEEAVSIMNVVNVPKEQ